MRVATLELHRPGQPPSLHTVGPLGLRIGRRNTNDLIVPDAGVSGQHLMLSWEGNTLLATDLNSRNGTRLAGVAISGPTVLQDGAILALGGQVSLVIRVAAAQSPSWVLRTEGRAHLVNVHRGLRFGGPGSDVVVADAPGHRAALHIDMDGVPWLDQGEDSVALEADTPFEVHGQRFALHHAADATIPDTLTLTGAQTEVSVEAVLVGDQASVRVVMGSAQCHASGNNRAMLLYLLAATRRKHLDEGIDPLAAGWTLDDQIRRDLWGRSATTQLRNNLQVLIRRTRQALEQDGLDGWLVEKRRGTTRLNADAVEVQRR